ncbi:DUF4810 domain-containing protein [Pseudomonas guariconensis]|uniref:DUF4810 domain-containing protein n=1 Tax=Pseudomonas guariconensis TaxID=1288410 RepID=UPI0018AAC471|nr:DUF4810 domain-containing protein [Pseudomonas guariconensis]MBF8755176.1 DUF4810 domain-containing protein [Pseudomonas guariconensis]
MTTPLSARCAGAALLLGCTLLAGCSGQKPMYQWESYQPQVYEYFKGESSKEEQAIALERDLEKIKAKNGSVPPGYHAQLGLLYAGLGKDDQMIQQLRTEKALFPESAAYMDFLMNNASKRGKQ